MVMRATAPSTAKRNPARVSSSSVGGCCAPEVKPEVVVEETDDPAMEENLLHRAQEPPRAGGPETSAPDGEAQGEEDLRHRTDEPPRTTGKTAPAPEEDEEGKGEENLLDRTQGGAK